MCTEKLTNNCLDCGRFYSINSSTPYCKNCAKNHCLNCLEDMLFSNECSSEDTPYCSLACQEEYLASKQVEMTLPLMEASVVRLHRSACNLHENLNLSYSYGRNFEDARFHYKYDSEKEEIICTIRIKQKYQRNPMSHIDLI